MSRWQNRLTSNCRKALMKILRSAGPTCHSIGEDQRWPAYCAPAQHIKFQQLQTIAALLRLLRRCDARARATTRIGDQDQICEG